MKPYLPYFFLLLLILLVTYLNILHSQVLTFYHAQNLESKLRKKKEFNQTILNDIIEKDLQFKEEENHIEQFSMVMLTHQRLHILNNTLRFYYHQNITNLDRIVIIWNDPDTEPPSTKDLHPVPYHLDIISTNSNSLNNRFFPPFLSTITTEAVFSIDDDVRIFSQELEFAFQIWKSQRDRIVGFPRRNYGIIKDEEGNRELIYLSDRDQKHVSLVLLGAAFYSKHYSSKYFQRMPEEILEWIDLNMNCEDIAFNMLVSDISKRPPLGIENQVAFGCPECGENTLHHRSGHYEQRSTCISKFVSILGHNPLRSTQAIMAPNVQPHLLSSKKWSPGLILVLLASLVGAMGFVFFIIIKENKKNKT